MSIIPKDLRYLSSHEWVRVEDDGTAYVGITDHAQHAMGDLVFVEVPEVGAKLTQGEEVGVVESVKAASDIYAPLSGTVIAINEALEDAPETVNTDPYGDGWMYRLKPDDIAEFDALLEAEDYAEQLEDEDSAEIEE